MAHKLCLICFLLLWLMAYGLWLMLMAYGLWLMAYALMSS
jgi:hypothetical protein